jgi:hypothetical protein
MHATRATWGEVEPRTYIQDRNGKIWRVDMLSNDRARLIDSDGKQVDIVRPLPGREVMILSPTVEEARYTLASALGARVLAIKDDNGKYACPPPSSWTIEEARWHMDRFHRSHTQGMSVDQIRTVHEADDDPAVPHTHMRE